MNCDDYSEQGLCQFKIKTLLNTEQENSLTPSNSLHMMTEVADRPGNVADDEDHHNADEDQGQVGLPPPGLARPQVSVSTQQRELQFFGIMVCDEL